jgi:type II secretory pathway pseudopilin PulG
MKFKTTIKQSRTLFANRTRAGFTLAEVLAAMVFMAIVIPVAIQGLRVASLAGEVGHRKSMALRVAERLLNESVVTCQWSQAIRNGVEQEGPIQFRWTVRNELWPQDAMRELSAEVTFAAQNQDYSVRLTTLVSQ